MVLTSSQSVRSRVRRSAVIHERDGLSHLTFHAMGTRCRVSLAEPSRGAANEFLDRVLDWIADFEAKYSRFLEDSLISRINAAAGKSWVELDEETDRLLAICAELCFLTRGAFDPTALPLIRLWNWKSSPPQIPTESELERARALVGWNRVQRRRGALFLPVEGMCLDFGGLGKEYAVDRVSAMARQHGVANVLVDFGQDIRAEGTPPGKPAWHIGLEDPETPGTCWASLALSGQAVATSGDYLRHFVHEGRRYGHIIDPRSGYPVDNGCRAVSVVAPTCTLAGALTTAAFVLGPEDGFRLLQTQMAVSGAVVTPKGPLLTPRLHEYLVQSR